MAKSLKAWVFGGLFLLLPLFAAFYVLQHSFNSICPQKEGRPESPEAIAMSDFDEAIAPVPRFDPSQVPDKASILRINTDPPFLMVLPVEETVDMAVSNWLHKGKYFAPHETTIFKLLLKDACGEARRLGKRPPLVVDVGANMGYFTLYALQMGCRVVSFEPQTVCLQYFEASVVLNGVEPGRHTLHKGVISNQTGFFTITDPGPDLGRAEVDAFYESNKAGTVPAYRLDDIIQLDDDDEIALLKIDTEGHECEIFPSMMNLLKQRKVKVMVVEIKATCPAYKAQLFKKLRTTYGYTVQWYPEDYEADPARPNWPYQDWEQVGNQTMTGSKPPGIYEDVICFRKDK
mmetsp:Transcript_26396/g.43223  ORF Transcript_26396/g.43223 Transcript_26396/m.43223 type:complete len:346 (-) Transcript_26396:57-1094(-)|eukprot:CAMPEP_0184676212 /NCGR_PEP_ID=MMETSP0308-20130426/88229_1 /TAXON_ID=38269 /ORGANISM="Gloeochaete witrockiana, Strain SAG 46.84" /LENGTH=345 /DNA_ID=CAMNT_0027124025 /DNA_START=215 /DNA_END=1252 /DNA_ORIENTATION=+